MNKKRIVTGVGVVLLITGIVGSIWSGIEVMPKLINDAQAMQNNLNQQEVLYKGKIDLAKLNINSKVSNIIIKKYDGKDVIVERSGNKNLSTITTKESGSELTIDEEFNNNNSNLGKSIDDIVRYLVDELYTSHNSDITVYIPENIDINVNTNNGGLYINGVNANNLNFNTQYGNISLSENSNIKTLNIKSNSDISLKVREVYCIDNLSIESNYVNIYEGTFVEDESKIPESIKILAQGGYDNSVNINTNLPIAKNLDITSEENVDLKLPISDYKFNFDIKTSNSISFDENSVSKYLGTSLENIDRAEDRHEFEEMLHKLDIPQPMGETAVTVDEALVIANKIGYPVLVRPSYVLGGRAMEIVHNDDDLKIYMATAVKEISHDAPILVDKYIVGKEMEIDAICDGEHVYIPGIMEHIERAGVHSGDSISVYPAPTASQQVKDTIVDYAIRIGKGFHFIGLYNIQFIVDKDEKVYVLEVNPRSSRTVPFLSKITGVPMSYVATRCVLGHSLKEQGYEEGVHPEGERVFVKAPVFSFAKLRSVDTTLGPEMKSTGEALGGDDTLEKALYKALLASGVKIPLHGNVLLTVADADKQEGLKIAKRFSNIGYGIYATKGTANLLKENGIYVRTVNKVNEAEGENVVDVIRKGRINYVINTMSISKTANQDGFEIRRAAAENNISCFTSLDTANAILRVLEAQTFTTISMNELED